MSSISVKDCIHFGARNYPLFLSIVTFLSFLITFNSDILYLFFGLVSNGILNVVLKEYVFRKACDKYGKKDSTDNKKCELGFLGEFSRPIVDKYKCNFGWGYSKTCNSYGMPSGHSQDSIYFTTVILLYFLNNYRQFTKEKFWIYLGFIIALIGISIYIMYSRINIFNCHTKNQVIVGGIIGFLYALFTYHMYANYKNNLFPM